MATNKTTKVNNTKAAEGQVDGVNNETIKAVDSKDAGETITTVVPKTQKANAVFAKMFAEPTVPARKDMIAAAMKEAGISKECAATYLQNYKRKNGLQKTATQPAA